MSGLALAQENVLSETWGPNLDLTIPSLEMPSTSVLDSKAKQEIMRGWTCCYWQELLDSVRQEHLEKSIESKLRVNQRRLQFTPYSPITTEQWALFWALQLADIWTTVNALKYSCVYEANPFLPDRPDNIRLVSHKTIFLLPLYYENKRQNLNSRDLNIVNSVTGLVVINNLEVRNYASKNCSKIK